MKLDARSGEVTHRPTLKKNKLTRRHKVVNERVEKTKKIDSRFDTRRSPIKWKTFHPRNIGVVYLYALITVGFTLWVPDTWLTWLTHRSVLNQNAILVIVALGLLVPLSAGVFDLSIGGTVSAAAVVVGAAAAVWVAVNIPKVYLKITIGGKNSYCSADGQRIHISRMPSTPLGRLLMTGLVYHEVAHKNYTQGSNSSGLLGEMTNVLEDIRVEGCLMKDRPGTGYDLERVTGYGGSLRQMHSQGDGPLDINLVTVPYDRAQAVRDTLRAGEQGLFFFQLAGDSGNLRFYPAYTFNYHIFIAGGDPI